MVPVKRRQVALLKEGLETVEGEKADQSNEMYMGAEPFVGQLNLRKELEKNVAHGKTAAERCDQLGASAQSLPDQRTEKMNDGQQERRQQCEIQRIFKKLHTTVPSRQPPSPRVLVNQLIPFSVDHVPDPVLQLDVNV
jgi:hypothetical protein